MTEPATEETTRKRHVHKEDSNANTASSTKKHSTPRKTASHGTRLRQSILKQTKRQKSQQKQIKMSLDSQSGLQKFYCALILNALAIGIGTILYFKPEFFFNHLRSSTGPQWPPHHLAVLYPPDVSPRNDVPTFFQQYAIATKENEVTRKIMKQLIAVRDKLRPFQIFVTAWERERMIQKYPMDDYCGVGFNQVYQAAQTIRHAEDMLHWCLLHTYQNDGFYQWNFTLKRSPISLSNNVHYKEEDTLKGMAAKLVGHDRIHPSFLWLPKKRERETKHDVETNSKKSISTFDMDSQLPTLMLKWLIETAPTINSWEYPRKMEEYIYQVVRAEPEKWMLFDTVCDHYRDDEEPDGTAVDSQQHEPFQNRGIMGRDCLQGQACCTVYLPEELGSPRNKLRPASSSDSRD